MTVALALGALLAVAVVLAAVRRRLHGEPKMTTLLSSAEKSQEQSAISSKQ